MGKNLIDTPVNPDDIKIEIKPYKGKHKCSYCFRKAIYKLKDGRYFCKVCYNKNYDLFTMKNFVTPE